MLDVMTEERQHTFWWVPRPFLQEPADLYDQAFIVDYSALTVTVLWDDGYFGWYLADLELALRLYAHSQYQVRLCLGCGELDPTGGCPECRRQASQAYWMGDWEPTDEVAVRERWIYDLFRFNVEAGHQLLPGEPS